MARGTTRSISASKTRPADTNAYAANDAIADLTVAPSAWVWQLTPGIGGRGSIIGATVASSDTTNTPRIEVDLYSAPPTPIADNAEATRLLANFSSGAYLGTLTFPALAKHTASSTVSDAKLSTTGGQVPLPFQADAGGNVYAIVRTLDGFTPASGASYIVTLGVLDD